MAKKTVVKKVKTASIDDMYKDLMDLKRSNAAGELVNPRAISSLKKDIARTKTAARMAELKELKENK